MALVSHKKGWEIVFILGGRVSNDKRENGYWETSICFCYNHNKESLKLTLRRVMWAPLNNIESLS